jgi:choline transporter-like protein 2/4/5
LDQFVSLGDPQQLLHPTDSDGNLCGSGNYTNRPEVYFFDWTQCVKAFNIPVNLLQGRPFICPTTQVCVEGCPTKTAYYKVFRDYDAQQVCVYGENATSSTIEDLVKEGKCASYVLNSEPLFGRCVPKQLQNLVNSLIEVGFLLLID